MLNILKVMGLLLLFIPFWEPNSRKLPWRFSCVDESTLKGTPPAHLVD
jgi:hypothetical protein